MNNVEPITILCPFCGEPNEILVDSTNQESAQIESCTVCHEAIDINAHIDKTGTPPIDTPSEEN